MGDTNAEGEIVSGHYLRHAWEMLTAERGWFKPMLVMAVARFIPVVGWLGTEGYALEWGRLTAWRVDARPKQKNVQIGKVLSSGWRGFVVSLGWNLALALLYWLVWGLTGGDASHPNRTLESILGIIYLVLWLLLGAIVGVAELRATIYQHFAAGYRADRVAQMCKADFGGLLHMVGIRLFGWIVKALILLLFVPIAIGTVLPAGIDYMMGMRYGSSYEIGSPLALHALLSDLSGLIPVFIMMFFLLSLVEVVFTMLTTTGVALWMRKFDIAHWGRSSDPLPPVIPGNDEGVVPPSGLGQNNGSSAA